MTLRIQNFTIIGQGVPALHVLTDKQTQSGIYYIDRCHLSRDQDLQSITALTEKTSGELLITLEVT